MMLRTPPSNRPRWVPPNEEDVEAGASADEKPRTLLESNVAFESQASQLVPSIGGGLSGQLLDSHSSRSYLDPSLVREGQEEDVGCDSLQCCHKCRSMVSRLIKERDELKAIIVSYDEAEAAIVWQSSTASLPPMSAPEKSKQLCIQQLEADLADAHNSMKQMKTELERSAQMFREQQHKEDSLALDLNKAVEKIKYLEQDSDHLREKIGVLEHKLACGEFNPAKTKIYMLQKNLETHNLESSDLVHGMAPRHALPSSHDSELVTNISDHLGEGDSKLASKVALLEQEVTVLRKRGTRYIEVFAEKTITFRSACELIFGYKVVMNEELDSSGTLFTLTSIYSKDGDMEKLEFRYVAGRIEMLANAYTSKSGIARQVTTFVQGFKSIPAFTANLTLELFNRSTIG